VLLPRATRARAHAIVGINVVFPGRCDRAELAVDHTDLKGRAAIASRRQARRRASSTPGEKPQGARPLSRRQRALDFLQPQAGAGGDHRGSAGVDGVDDLGVVDPLQVDGRDPEVGVPELALDDVEGHALPGHLDGMRVA
jgi:hypothetical protein